MDGEVKFQPLERSKRGRKSKINEKDFLNLVKLHHLEILKNGRMVEINHRIISEFADKLCCTKKCIHLKLTKYVNSTIFSGFNSVTADPDTIPDTIPDTPIIQNIDGKASSYEHIISSLQASAHTSPFCDYIKKLSIFPSFCVHYHSEFQLECFRQQLKTEWSVSYMQANEGMIKPILSHTEGKTKTIFIHI